MTNLSVQQGQPTLVVQRLKWALLGLSVVIFPLTYTLPAVRSGSSHDHCQLDKHVDWSMS